MNKMLPQKARNQSSHKTKNNNSVASDMHCVTTAKLCGLKSKQIYSTRLDHGQVSHH